MISMPSSSSSRPRSTNHTTFAANPTQARLVWLVLIREFLSRVLRLLISPIEISDVSIILTPPPNLHLNNTIHMFSCQSKNYQNTKNFHSDSYLLSTSSFALAGSGIL